MRNIRLWMMVFLLSLSTSVHALYLPNDDYPHFFSVEVFTDDSAELSLDEVIQKNQWTDAENHFSYGFSSANYWMKISLQNIQEQYPFLLIQ